MSLPIIMYGVPPTEPWDVSPNIEPMRRFEPIDLLFVPHTAGAIAIAWYVVNDLVKLLALVPRYVWVVRHPDAHLIVARFTNHEEARKWASEWGGRVVRIRLRGAP